MNNYCVYKITFPSGKFYFGITNNFKRRKNQHKKETFKKSNFKVYNALNKYGFDNCLFEIVLINLTIEEARNEEIKLIKENNSVENGYNTTYGGTTAPILNTEVKNKIMKKIRNTEHRLKKSQKMKDVFLKNPEISEKISKSTKKMWEEKKDLIVEKMRKKQKNPDHILKMKEARKKAWNSEERRNKASERSKIKNNEEKIKEFNKKNLNSKESIEKRNATKRTIEWRNAQSLRLKNYYKNKKDIVK